MSTDGSTNGSGSDDRSWGAAWLFFAAMVLTLIGITHLVTGLTAASTSFDVWSDVPDDKGYAAMRDAIVAHVRVLLDEIQRRKP